MGVTSELLHAKPMVGRTYIVCTPKFFSADPRKTEQRFLESVYVQTSILEGASADLERTPDQAWPGGCPASANPRLFLLQPRKTPPHLRRNLPMFQSAAPERVYISRHTHKSAARIPATRTYLHTVLLSGFNHVRRNVRDTHIPALVTFEVHSLARYMI